MYCAYSFMLGLIFIIFVYEYMPDIQQKWINLFSINFYKKNNL